MLGRLLDLVRSSQEEIERLAIRETQPGHAAEFEPICRGPLIAVAILAYIGIASLPVACWRLLRSTRRVMGS